ncbi:MAG: hypothetical protein J0L72_11140 [Armatimonadetes bacterium]|nr:hypothetical protein [Armatimonadota bacterium]
MLKTTLFVLGCGLAALLVMLLWIAITIGMIGKIQVFPSSYSSAFGYGIAEGVFLACMNALGKWPRLGWRRILIANTLLKLALLGWFIAVALIPMVLNSSGRKYHYVYFAPEPGAWLWPSLFAAPVAVWVLVLRWYYRKFRRSNILRSRTHCPEVYCHLSGITLRQSSN